MATLPWNSEIIKWFVENRIDWLTQIFVFMTFLGDEMGYILLVVTIYWLYNKKLGIQLVMAVILTSFINQTLKVIIKNPRPFVAEGTYQENWGIPESSIEETSHSYSTPSGHAQGSSTFWWYLHLKVKSRVTFIIFPIMILLIGLSRPYLGVHYLEDIILGWIIGFLLVVFLMRYDDRITNWWDLQSNTLKIIIAIIPSLVFTFIVGLIFNYNPNGQSYVSLFAIFSGISIGSLFDKKYIQFNPDLSEYGSLVSKVVIALGRMFIGLLIVGVFLIGLDAVFSSISSDDSVLGFLFRWIRYFLVSFSGLVFAPFVFTKIKLSNPQI